MSKVRSDIDVCWHSEIQGILQTLRDSNIKIVDFDPSGPGGGNPNLLIESDSKESMHTFLTKWHENVGGDDSKWIDSLIREVK